VLWPKDKESAKNTIPARFINKTPFPVQVVLVVHQESLPQGFEGRRGRHVVPDGMRETMTAMEADHWAEEFAEVGLHVIMPHKHADIKCFPGQVLAAVSCPAGAPQTVALMGETDETKRRNKYVVMDQSMAGGDTLRFAVTESEHKYGGIKRYGGSGGTDSWRDDAARQVRQMRLSWQVLATLRGWRTRAGIWFASLGMIAVPVCLFLLAFDVVSETTAVATSVTIFCASGLVLLAVTVVKSWAKARMREFSPFTPTVHVPGVMSWLDVAVALSEVPKAPYDPYDEGLVTADAAVAEDGTGMSLRLVGWPEVDPDADGWADADEGGVFEHGISRRMQYCAIVMSGTSFVQSREAAALLAGTEFWPEVYMREGRKRHLPLDEPAAELRETVGTVAAQLCRFRVWLLGTAPTRLKHPGEWSGFLRKRTAAERDEQFGAVQEKRDALGMLHPGSETATNELRKPERRLTFGKDADAGFGGMDDSRLGDYADLTVDDNDVGIFAVGYMGAEGDGQVDMDANDPEAAKNLKALALAGTEDDANKKGSYVNKRAKMKAKSKLADKLGLKLDLPGPNEGEEGDDEEV